MSDPGAFGTLIIGLDAIRRDEESVDPSRPGPAGRVSRRAMRSGLVNGLRNLADTLDPRHPLPDSRFARGHQGPRL